MNRGRMKWVAMLVLVLSFVLVTGSTLAQGMFTPGEYTAVSAGFGGDVTVKVKVGDDAIISVQAEGSNETVGIGSTAVEKLPGIIVEKQTLAVDALAGCTITSKAVLSAAEDALRQAGATDAVIFAEPTEAADAAQEEMNCNLVIVGAGAAGLSAALSAQENGVEDILVLEKMPAIGGATATAGGGMPGYAVSKDPDETEKNIEELFLHLCKIGKFSSNARLTMMQTRLSTPTIEWLKREGVGITGEPVEGEAIVNYGCEGRAATAINTVYQRVLEEGVPVMLNTRATRLMTDGNAVVGVEAVGENGQKIIIHANKVLMATGGYGNNKELITDHSILDRVIYYGPVGATGDGHIMMKEIGIPMFNMDKVATKHFGVETEPGYGIHIHFVVAQLFKKTGSIAVNKNCQRVVNEDGDELDIARASMCESEDGRLYIVMDQAGFDLCTDILDQYTFLKKDKVEQLLEENGAGVTKFVKGATLAEAAAAMGLDGVKLEETVAAYNANALAGNPDPFKRENAPAMSTDGPFYILQTVARYATSLGGVNISDHFEVLDVNEQPVPGLYAAGEVVGNINGAYAEYLVWCFGSGMEFGNVIGN